MTLTEHRARTLTLAELAERAGALVSRAGLLIEDGRVGALDERTLRYHQTLGLLDRPLRYEGRQALYGYRHLLQAVSVRLLQARGHSLAQIQSALTGVSTEALEAALLRDLPDLPEARDAIVQAPQPPPAPVHLIAAELAPGVTVLLDPRHAARADRIFAALSAALPDLNLSGGPR